MAGLADDWSELTSSEQLNLGMMAKLKESWYHARQEDDHHKSIVQQVLVRCTEFLRRIIAPVEGQGGVILVLWVPSLPPLSTRRLHLVTLSDARGRREEQEEAVQLGVRGVRRPVQLEGPEWTHDGADPNDAKVFRFGLTLHFRVRAKT